MKRKSEIRRTKKNLIRIIEKIAIESADSDLSGRFIGSIKGSADEISAFLGCNRIQSVLFSVICNLNFTSKTVSLGQIAAWLGCNPITVAGYIGELEGLRQKMIIRQEKGEKKHRNNNISALCWSVNPEIFNALGTGEAIVTRQQGIADSYDLIKAVSGLLGRCSSDEITQQEMWDEIRMIEKRNAGIFFQKEIKRMISDPYERLLFVYICNEFFAGNLDAELIPALRRVIPDERLQLELRLRISNGISPLVKEGLLEMRERFFNRETEIRLSSKAQELLFKDNRKLDISFQESRSPNLIPAGEITFKEMFFNREEKEKLDFIGELLKPKAYNNLVKRLAATGNNTGFALLFHGSPGTGKTESVYQIARSSGRDIYQVNISETKSKWFGESEQLIKGVFDRYRELCKAAKVRPMLLFNEADGIFGTRKTAGDSSMDQTENAIQNIILQELEDLEGILIATTNMTQNLDKAFDRRFLYKIKFGKPDRETRSQIWKNKIPSLTGPVAEKLSQSFDLSGGQIDNVARKFVTHKVLRGNTPELEQIEAWCREESPRHEITRIGYNI